MHEVTIQLQLCYYSHQQACLAASCIWYLVTLPLALVLRHANYTAYFVSTLSLLSITQCALLQTKPQEAVWNYKTVSNEAQSPNAVQGGASLKVIRRSHMTQACQLKPNHTSLCISTPLYRGYSGAIDHQAHGHLKLLQINAAFASLPTPRGKKEASWLQQKQGSCTLPCFVTNYEALSSSRYSCWNAVPLQKINRHRPLAYIFSMMCTVSLIPLTTHSLTLCATDDAVVSAWPAHLTHPDKLQIQQLYLHCVRKQKVGLKRAKHNHTTMLKLILSVALKCHLWHQSRLHPSVKVSATVTYQCSRVYLGYLSRFFCQLWLSWLLATFFSTFRHFEATFHVWNLAIDRCTSAKCKCFACY